MARNQHQELTAAGVIIVILLGFRVFGSVFNLLLAGDPFFGFAHLAFAAAYLAAVVGVTKHERWGSAVAISVAAIDASVAFITGGVFTFGALIVDLIIIFLAAQEVKHLSAEKSRKSKRKAKKKK